MTQAQAMKYTATNDSVTVIYGGRPVTVKKGAANFEGLRRAVLEEDWGEVPFHLRSDSSLERWAKGKFSVKDGQVSFEGSALPTDINDRILEMATKGEDPSSLLKFWENLQQNPSKHSVDQLFRFLKNIGIPLTPDGHFLAYKAVRADFKDVYSGTIENKPGAVVKMVRNKISDDPNHACHEGLHVGALEYAENFGGHDKRLVICKVNPAHVVSVPNDHSCQKMRVCEYEVVGMHGEGHLPNTSVDDDMLPKLRAVTGKRSAFMKRFDAMDEAQLMKESFEDLRKYASQGVGIVGAYRITGGKWALVQAISRSRV